MSKNTAIYSISVYPHITISRHQGERGCTHRTYFFPTPDRQTYWTRKLMWFCKKVRHGMFGNSFTLKPLQPVEWTWKHIKERTAIQDKDRDLVSEPEWPDDYKGPKIGVLGQAVEQDTPPWPLPKTNRIKEVCINPSFRSICFDRERGWGRGSFIFRLSPRRFNRAIDRLWPLLRPAPIESKWPEGYQQMGIRHMVPRRPNDAVWDIIKAHAAELTKSEDGPEPPLRPGPYAPTDEKPYCPEPIGPLPCVQRGPWGPMR